MSERNRGILAERRAGAKYPAIASRHGISAARARQIVQAELDREWRTGRRLVAATTLRLAGDEADRLRMWMRRQGHDLFRGLGVV